MPKEQVRKRGKRKAKHVEEEKRDVPGEGVVDNAQQRADSPGPSTTGAAAAAGASAAASAGIHPSRLALLKGGHRPSAPAPGPSAQYGPPQTEHLDANGAGAVTVIGGEDPENGEAQWIRGPRIESEFPFGELDPDLKGYFKTVEEQVKDWEGTDSVGEEREDRKTFLQSVLTELRNHELVVATDPECSVVLERLLPSMGDWGRRVLGDTFAAQWETLIRHRFGSHVLQSWIRLGADTLDREARGVYPPQHSAQLSSDQGTLRTITELFSDMLTTLQTPLPSLLAHQHASPPIRLLLLVLSPSKSLPDMSGEGDGPQGQGQGGVRSKKSNKFRKNQGVKGKSFVDEANEKKGKGKEKEKDGVQRRLPEELVSKRKEMREALMLEVKENEWKVMGVDVVGSIAVQLILESEVEDGASEQAGSLLDSLTEGLVSDLAQGTDAQAKEYIPSLLTSQAGTHMLEAILQHSPSNVFDKIWELYFVGKLGRLAGHPTGNYVVAKAVSRLELEKVEGLVKEVQSNAGGRGLIKSGRTSVLLALVERVIALGEGQNLAMKLIWTALDMPEDKHSFLVPCMMTLKTYPLYEALVKGEAAPQEDESIPEDNVDKTAEEQAAAAAKYAAWQNRRNPKAPTTGLEPALQGSLLLQAVTGLGRDEVFESLFAQPQTTLLSYATNPIASRFLDSVLTTSSVPPRWRKKLMMSFMGKYKELVEDRLGSRVGDTIWEHADGFLKEKIARSLAPHATALSLSQYGRFYAYKLKLHLLQRRPDEWKEEVIGVRHHFAHEKDARIAASAPAPASAQSANATLTGAGEEVKEKKRTKREEGDEIDAMFAEVDTKSKKRKQ